MPHSHSVRPLGDRASRGGRGGRSYGFRPYGGKRDERRQGGQRHSKEIFQPGKVPILNSVVEETENRTHNLQDVDYSGSYLTGRPGFGTRGVRVALYANYFELSTPAGCEVCRYQVEIVQTGVPKQKQRQIFNLLLENHLAEKRHCIATDFRSTIISSVDLFHGKPEPEQAYEVRYKGESQSEYSENAPMFRVKVIFSGKVSVSSLVDYLSSTNVCAMFRDKSEVIQALDLIVGHEAQASPRLASTSGNTHFPICDSSAERFNLGAGLEALRGFSIGVRAATARLLVNCQVDYTVFFQKAELTKVIAAYRQDGSPSVSRLESFLRRLQVQVTHIHQQARFKIIVGLASPLDGQDLPHPPIIACHGAGPREVQFWRCDPDPASGKRSGSEAMDIDRASPEEKGKYITVAEFFLQKYGIQLDPHMPVVKILSRNKQPAYLPADVCMVRDGQPARSRITEAQKLKMNNFAIRKPAANARSITSKGAELLGITSGMNTNTTLRNFGFNISPDLITVPGRVLPSPSVLYANKGKVDIMSGGWKQRSAKFCKPCRLSSWDFLYISTAKDRDYFPSPADLRPCIAGLRSKLNDYGVTTQAMTNGHRVDITPALSPSTGKYSVGKLDQTIGSALKHLTRMRKPELILVILPSTNGDIYNSVKRICDVHMGITNICTLAPKFFKKDEAYMANLCLKFNLKMGGVNHVLGADKTGVMSEGRTMVVGVDATHPLTRATAAGPDMQPVVVGMVASVDKHLAQWPADVRVEKSQPRRTTAAHLDDMLETRLQLWASVNKNQLPENIVIYRGGISDGEYARIVEDEVPLLKSACAKLYSEGEKKKGLPRLSVIIVSKRHRTRFYPSQENDADRLSNPRSGTVVDRGVTEAREWEFYLQAHAPLHGTARPAHYYVAWDEVFRFQKSRAPFANAADALEGFTHDLCYLFGRTNKAVSLCAPAYYADLLCARARCYLTDAFNDNQGPSNRPSEYIVQKKMGSRGVAQAVDFTNIRVHSDLRKTMFYI